jgi:hypothetical protein
MDVRPGRGEVGFSLQQSGRQPPRVGWGTPGRTTATTRIESSAGAVHRPFFAAHHSVGRNSPETRIVRRSLVSSLRPEVIRLCGRPHRNRSG